MILLTHILIAISSIIWTTYAYVQPSKKRVGISYGLVAATLVSGSILVASSHTALLGACASGLAYSALVTTFVVLAQRKLAKQRQK